MEKPKIEEQPKETYAETPAPDGACYNCPYVKNMRAVGSGYGFRDNQPGLSSVHDYRKER